MRRGWKLFAFALSVLALFLVGCASQEEAEVDTSAEEWAAVEAAKEALEAKRQEIADLKIALSADAESDDATSDTAGEEGAEGETAEPLTPEKMQEHLANAQQDVVSLAEDFMTKLVEFLNNQNMVEGAELTSSQKQAINWKTHEDIVLAQEYIEKGGDYRRALDIYAQAKGLDPDNQELAAAIAQAESDRYMTEERFAQVKKSMTEGQVRALLGQVHHSNLRDYPENKTVGWFFPKEDGGAAGVFFREKNGEKKVYSFDYGAVKPPVTKVIEAGEGDAAGTGGE